jgi:DNA phosphorothioation-dependent restriction protein DptG
MVETLNTEYLSTLLKGKHDTGKAMEILPFSSRKAKEYREKFQGVLGELVRMICALETERSSGKVQDFYFSEDGNPLSEQIASNVEFDHEDDMYDFVRFINDYLFSHKEIKPIHPYLFNYIALEGKKNEFVKFARFIIDILIQDNQKIEEIFKNKETDDVLTELIMEKVESLKPRKEEIQQYQPLMSSIIKLYQEDMIYLSNHKDYFLTAFPVLTQYYIFMYVCQLIVKFDQFELGNLEDVQPLYFALDWESINKRRKAANEIEGFRLIRNRSSHLFPHVHTLSQLSHNYFNKEFYDNGEKLKVYSYSELYRKIHEQGADFEQQFFKELKGWIEDYRKLKNVETVDDSEDIPKAFKVLFNCLKEGMNQDVSDKYGKSVEDLGANHFIKSRGSLGQILNIKHEFLLLLTAISVKDDRIPLNELFVEYEKRGVAFDRYSKKEIINLLDNLNILDKKSDSGDSQYVKPIL